MARMIELQSAKTYATRANAEKAVHQHFAKWTPEAHANLVWFVHQGSDGRFFPVFVGERTIQAMLHFKFTVVA